MSSKQRIRRKHVVDSSSTAMMSAARVPSWLLPFALGAVVVGTAVFMATSGAQSSKVTKPPSSSLAHQSERALPSFGDLAMMPDDDLAKIDVAVLNLRCAQGLPASENLDIGNCLKTLDLWAQSVKFETDRHLYKYHQAPGEYENSEGYYRMMMLATVLQQDFGVHYNAKRIRDVDFTNSNDIFIHGMINGKGGTCVSMPVLYTAVARRLGYPVYLVTANAHIFCRWEDSKERFNIEATSRGMNSYDDDHYLTWPKPLTREVVERGWFLQSLDNAGSLSAFLAARGHCLEDIGRVDEARVAYAVAAEKSPGHPLYRGFLSQAIRGSSSNTLRIREIGKIQAPTRKGSFR